MTSSEQNNDVIQSKCCYLYTAVPRGTQGCTAGCSGGTADLGQYHARTGPEVHSVATIACIIKVATRALRWAASTVLWSANPAQSEGSFCLIKSLSHL